jgi:cellulose synthase/poly-beta-1,6-N-acetylglucosamine synthase-like glycosyltransferase/peptidoglycan/xylan/chitin deacetylase (PgdA/CDA1 family)/spore germination protein YaaH
VPAEQRKFVFHDPSGKRWVRFRRLLQTGSLVAALLLALLILVAFSGTQLPSLGLPAVAHIVSADDLRGIIRGDRVEKNIPYRDKKPVKIQYVRSQSPVLHPRPAAKGSGGAPLVFGFFVNWDPGSIVSLRLHLSHITHLVPEWLTLQNAKGDVDDQSDQTVIAIAQQANLPILALLTNFRGGWQPDDVRHVINDADLRRDLIVNIRSNLAEHKFAGVNVDFEDMTRRDRAPLVRFMKELAEDLHRNGFIVTEDVPVGDDAYDIKQLAAVNDFLVPMVYDEHYQSGEPGPVASEKFFEDKLDELAKLADPSKLVVGFGNYGYDWPIGSTGGREVTFDDVMAAASGSHGSIEWNAVAENPVLRFNAGGQQHEVWFLDAVTALNEITAAHDTGFRGVGLWRLGAEDPGLWKVLQREIWPEDDFKPAPLQTMEATLQAPRHYGGSGEILRVTSTPHGGTRTVSSPPTPDGDFAEQYTKLPTPWVITHSGDLAGNKVICLTFDDGPDAQFTPRILDVLKSRHVPATFFVIGLNADNNPALIKREYDEGHEIGNHTYTHPNVAIVSVRRLELELTTTQRILENLLGVSTTFFRPPYNADSDPQTPEEILPLQHAQQYGYTTVAETIDPRDWQPGVTADSIVSEVASEIGNGHIILLHDAGGDRNATIEALPRIIDRYVAEGYRFALVGDLLGRSRAQIMPKPAADEMRMAQIEGQALGLQARFLQSLGILFLAAIYLTLARSAIFGILAILQKIRAKNQRYDETFRPPVSVIIAAFNEETVITRTVESILRNGYADLEIIVVDDGSKDGTLAVLREAFADNPSVQILTQLNAGKSAALNNAISCARHQILVAVDADTLFLTGTIAKLVRHFSDPRVGAVSGNARVGNRKKWITRFQSIEYIYGFNLDRRALDYLNAITVVPGAVGAWRRDLVVAQGGFGHDTLAEDADLTLAIRRDGHVIRYEQEAIAYTEAPEDGRSLAKQRFRWSFGTLQAAWKHRDALFVPRYGTLGFVALPSIWLFQVMLSSLSPFAEVAMLVALTAGNWRIVIAYYFAFFALEVLTGFLAYALEGVPAWDLFLLLFQRIYYRQMMLYVLVKSLTFALRGRLVGWGKLERKASVGHVG